MSIANDVRTKIASKKQEIVKLQSEKVTIQVEIKKAEKQLQSVMALMDDFDVIILYTFYYIGNISTNNFSLQLFYFFDKILKT